MNAKILVVAALLGPGLGCGSSPSVSSSAGGGDASDDGVMFDARA
jgi:hypothetical protein